MARILSSWLLALMAIMAGASAASGQDAQVDAQVDAQDMVIGQADAPVTLIEYASLSCPHCADFHQNVLPALKEQYIDTGKLRYVFRHYLLNQADLMASTLARCGEQPWFFTAIDGYFGAQYRWVNRQFIDAVPAMAAEMGMAEDQIDACLSNRDIQRTILSMGVSGARDYGINETPSFIINGTRHTGGYELEDIADAIDAALANTP